MDDNDAPSPRDLLEKIVTGGDLTVDEAEHVIGRFMEGLAGEPYMAALLTAVQCKGAAPSELAGGVRALRTAMIPVEAPRPEKLVDTAGTGGGAITTFNISTAAALVAAGAGIPIAKHGNRSFTSRSGSADVLEALGVRIELTPEQMGRVLQEAGIVFMYAPLLHPAMRHVGPVRRALGITTMMNLLGPLTNPAGARRQVVGVADPDLISLVVRALGELGHRHALVVHGEPGMDELSVCGRTRVAEMKDGAIHEFEIGPEDVGLVSHPPGALAGGEPEDNAHIVERVLDGSDTGGPRAAVVLNAAAAIYVGGGADSLEDAVEAAAASIDSGSAAAALTALREAAARD